MRVRSGRDSSSEQTYVELWRSVFVPWLTCWQNIYAETTFVCPSYWMAMAYNDYGRSSYKYQFSVEPALHGADVSGCKWCPPPFQDVHLVPTEP